MGLKIFSSFISVLIIFIITFLTFFSSPEKKLDYYSKFKLPNNGVFSVIRDKSGEFAEFDEKTDSQIFLERFDYLDKIFYNKKGSYKKTENSSLTSLKVGKGKFVFDFSFPKKYEIAGTGFKLNFVGPIKIYINTEIADKVDVFSFDNVVELTLLGLDDGKEKTKVYIYPHMYFPFDLLVNKVSTNTDFFRTTQLNPGIDYVNQNLYTNEFKLDNYKSLDNYFFRSIISYFSTEYLATKGDDSILKENFNNMTYDYIKKYFYVFVNDNKKISFYKDLIYMNLLKVYMSPKNSDSLFSDIADDYKKLKGLSKKDYDEMLKVLVYFKSKFLLGNKTLSIETELKYDEILSTVLSFQKTEGEYMLYYIFNLYDLGRKDSFFDGITSFSDSYLSKNGIKIQNDKLIGYDESKNIKLGYYISFLDNIIVSHLVNETNIEDIKGAFNVFNKYSLISVKVYSTGGTYDKQTIIVSHLNLLKMLSEYIRSNFFEEELDKGIILVKKKGLDIDSNIIDLFEKSYNTLFDFLTNNKAVFDKNKENDSMTLKEYEFISNDLNEYLSALKNYDKYKLKKSDLYSIQTIGGYNVKKVIYNIDDITTYLSNFNGVNTSTIKVKTNETGNVYNVNLNIGGKDFSFDLYPYNNFSVKNIYIDGVRKNLTYSLNLIKEKMDQSYNSSSNPDDKNANDFKNFFINTFLKIQVTINPGDDPEPVVPKQPELIRVFIRDKLLGTRGEFSNILDFTKMESDNITVDNKDDKISIKLKGVKTTFTYNVGSDSNTYGAYLDSDYSIGTNEHYFSKIKLKLYKSIKDGNRTTEDFGLGDGKEISIEGNVSISLFKDYMSNLMSYYNYIVFVNDALVKKVGEVNISVNTSKIVKFSFTYNGNNYEVLLLKSSIINFKRDGEKVLQNTFNYSDLPNRIDLLIK